MTITLAYTPMFEYVLSTCIASTSDEYTRIGSAEEDEYITEAVRRGIYMWKVCTIDETTLDLCIHTTRTW